MFIATFTHYTTLFHSRALWGKLLFNKTYSTLIHNTNQDHIHSYLDLLVLKQLKLEGFTTLTQPTHILHEKPMSYTRTRD